MGTRWLEMLRRNGEPSLGEGIVALAQRAARQHRQELAAGGVTATVPDAQDSTRPSGRFDSSAQRPGR